MRNGVVLLCNRKGHIFGFKFLTVKTNLLGIFWQKYNGHVTVRDHICEWALTNMDDELYCCSDEFPNHLFNSINYDESSVIRGKNFN
jgi:hypothetical protein